MDTLKPPERTDLVTADERTPIPERRTSPWLEAFKVVTITRLGFFIVAFAATWFLSPETDGPSNVGFLEMWTRWDARHFMQIAEFGYFDPRSDANATAFFPLFPLIVRALSWTGLSNELAGMVITYVSTIVAGAYLYKLAEEEVGEGAGRRAVTYLVLFPTAVFLTAPYSESLFLAGAVPAFYYARRERWHLVAFPTAVAMGARFAGVFLIFGLILEFVRQKRFDLDRVLNAGFAVVVGAMPLIAYSAYLAQTTGDPFHFKQAQEIGWGRDLVGPVGSFLATWRTWGDGYETNWVLAWRVEILAAVIGVAFVGWALAKKEWGYAGFMGATLAVLLSSTWYFSIPRMLVSFFPIMVLLAAWTARDRNRHEYLVMLLGPLAALGVVVFTQEIWFF